MSSPLLTNALSSLTRFSEGRTFVGFVRRSGRRERRHLAILRGEIAEVADLVDAQVQTTEGTFVGLSTSLNQLHQGAADLSRQTAELVDAARSGLAALDQDQLTTGSLRSLQSMVQNAEDQVSLLRQSTDSLAQLVEQGSSVSRIALLLQTIGYNFAVESARTSELQQVFGSFVDEVRQLGAKVAELAAAVSEHALRARDEQTASVRTLIEGSSRLRQLAHDAEGGLRNVVGLAHAGLASVHALADSAAGRAQSVEEHTSDAVYHLQRGDIVRQKLEHVRDSLCTAPDAALGGHDLLDLVTIQLAQIESVRNELRVAREQLETSFAGVAEASALLLDDLTQLANAQGQTQKDGPLRGLHEELQNLQKLAKDGAALRASADVTTSQATAASTVLTRHLDEVNRVNQELHLQALNSIVRTAWLGDDGRALSVLSAHVHDVAQESAAAVLAILPHLEHLRQSGSRGAGSGDGAASTGDGEFRLETQAEQLERLSAQLTRYSSAAHQLLERQGQHVEEARAQMAELDRLEAALELAAQRLSAVRPQLDSLAGSREGLTSRIASPSDNYTMESEREIHRRVLGQSAGTSATGSAGPAPAPTQTPPAPPSHAGGDASLGDNVELF